MIMAGMRITMSTAYHKEWFADFLHGFPHVDFSFENVNSTFNPESTEYREALAVWGCIPLIWCAILWIAFLTFFCVRCCGKSERKRSRGTCSCVFSGFLLLLSCGALAAAFYGNAEVHSGVHNAVHALHSANKTVETSLEVCNSLDRIVDNAKSNEVQALIDAVNGIRNATFHTKIDGFIKKIEDGMNTAKSEISSLKVDMKKVDFEEIADTTKTVEHYRWTVTIVVYCLCIAIFLLAFAGLLKKSKWMLILSTALLVIFMVTIWGATSFYFAVAIGTGDFCVDPDTFVITRVKGTVEEDVLEAFIKCTDSLQPYQKQIIDAQTAVTEAVAALNFTVNLAKPFNISGKLSGPVTLLRRDLNFMLGNLSSLTTLIGSCDTLHGDYVEAARGICIIALKGVLYLVLFSALVGMSSALMVICSAYTWPYFLRRGRSKIQGYTRVDDSDPFLPHPPPYQDRYGSFRLTGRPNVLIDTYEEDTSVTYQEETRETPPPAYHSGHFMQQYSNLAPRPSSVQSSQFSA